MPRVVSRFEDLVTNGSEGKRVKVGKASLNQDASYFDSNHEMLPHSTMGGGSDVSQTKEVVIKGDREQRLIEGHMQGTRINISIRGEILSMTCLSCHLSFIITAADLLHPIFLVLADVS